MRFIGRCTLSMDRAYDGTHYKYAIIKNGEVVWEELIEFQRYRGSIVDRFLYIPDKYLTPGGKFLTFFSIGVVSVMAANRG